MTSLLLTDYYKTQHHRMDEPGCTRIYSNLTARKSRMPGVDYIVFVGLQNFAKEYLIDHFNKHFFSRPIAEVIEEYKFAVDVDTKHIEALHKLGYLPIRIKALPEGSLVPIRVACLTITNTLPEFYWLPNYLETLMSCSLWQIITSATIAHQFRKLLDDWSMKTVGNTDFVKFQGHDFSMRGMSSVESAILSGMGHLFSFVGTDTIPAIYQLKKTYNATGLIGCSVPATEHSIQCLGTKEGELDTYKRLLELYPTGILSVVSDTWDLWNVLTNFMPVLKEQILARDGKLVIRPDSGDPADIICGNPKDVCHSAQGPEEKGVIQLLFDVFGGTINEKGYIELDPHVGAIYGDSISLERANDICARLEERGFASTNIVFGIGSYSYQYNTRDTFGFAVKATYGEVNGVGRTMFKDPITDDGTKKSAKGLLTVWKDEKGKYVMQDDATWEQEDDSYLETVFLDGKLVKEFSLEEIRANLKSS